MGLISSSIKGLTKGFVNNATVIVWDGPGAYTVLIKVTVRITFKIRARRDGSVCDKEELSLQERHTWLFS